MKFQQTIGAELKISGQALHNGSMVKMRILPQPVDTGILFSRPDLPDKPTVKAAVHSIIDTKKSVTIGKDDWKIATIEHIMAVFHGLGIDNVLVEVEGEEIPSGDGSGRYFIEKILQVGVVTQDKPRNYTYIQEPLWIEGTVLKQNEPLKSMLIAFPGEELQINFLFTSDHQVTGNQFFQYTLTPESFIKEIAPARTIAFVKEIDYLRSQGLAMSDNFDCAVIVGDHGYQNELRFQEEIVRHKIFDLIGDLYLLGPLVGRIIAIRSGHTLDLELAKNIYKQAKR